MEKKDKIISFLNDQIAQSGFKSKAYVFDSGNVKKPNRSIFIKIKAYLDDFTNGNPSKRWVTLTGLRGAGKTTILYQLLYASQGLDCYKLALSVDQITQILGSDISEILSVFEEIIGRPFENLDKPLLLFLDEVQYDPKWGIVLKTIYDRSNKVFIFCTGSAAILMNSNTDIARRTIFEKLFPLSFCEFLKIKYKKYEIKGLSLKIREAILNSKNASDAFEKLRLLEGNINKYYLGVSRIDFDNYLYYGTLPFMIALENEALVYDQISKTLERVVDKDIPQLGNFTPDIINKIPSILYAVADMDAFNFSTLSEKFEISRQKVADIFATLEKTEILFRIYPYGSHLNQVTKKPSKYLFSSPAFRAMYYKMIGNIISDQNAKGKLLEDLVGMYLQRYLYKNPLSSITFDSGEGGADFIVKSANNKIVIEVGVGKKNYRQVEKTAIKTNPIYSIVISQSENILSVNQEKNSIMIPLRIFLLI